MNKKSKTVITVLSLTLILLAVAARQNRWEVRSRLQELFRPSSVPTPEDGVYKTLDAARAGDTDVYLDCFSGAMRSQIEQLIKETSRAKFARYLTNQNKRFTSVAVSMRDGPAPDNAHVRVEYVYPERNEVQDLYLRLEGGAWRITKAIGSEQITTLIPYGTVVTD